jgi:phosphatidate cytidylyltransferase
MKKMPDLKKRFAASIVIYSLLALLLFFSHLVFIKVIIVLLACLLSATAVWEYCQLFLAKEISLASKLLISFSSIIIITFSLTQHTTWNLLPLFILFLSAIILFLAHFKDISNVLLKMTSEFFSLIYIAFPMCAILGILFLDFNNQDGRWWLLYLILVTKITDIGAFFIGRIWGRHKLAPSLSPNKTVEGAIAGLLFAEAGSVALFFLGHYFSNGAFDLTLAQALIIGVIIGILGQIGDLSESVLKRDGHVKDSNKLPGLGGVLDMLDSLLFTAPFLYFFLKAIELYHSGAKQIL